MRTNAKTQHKDLAIRQARRWSEQHVPTWQDFWAGGEARKAWRSYWLYDFPLDLVQWVLFHVYSVLPIDLVSWLGDTTARQIIPRAFPGMVKRTMMNLGRLEPTWSEEKRREVTWRQFGNLGRIHSEFPVLHRLMKAGRIRVENSELLMATVKAGPVVLVGVHTGNWEVMAPVARHFGIQSFFVYEPQPSRMQNYLLLKGRLRVTAPGSMTMPPGPAAARAAMRWLRQGKAFLIFCDESYKGLSVAPFFDKPPHLSSNFAIAVRLARQSNAAILPFHVVRHKGCNFTVSFGPLVPLPPTDNPGAALLDDVIQLNSVMEPMVKDHLEQWFWLNWPVPGVNYQ